MKLMLGAVGTGVVALLLWKIAAVFLLPLVGMAVGFAILVVKVVFIGTAICIAIWLARRWARDTTSTA